MLNSFFSIFHLYGLIIGLAAWVGIFLVEKKAKKYGVEEPLFWQIFFWCAVPAIIGARLYHVITDFQYYRFALIDSLKIWNGGLSIFGAVIGGIFGLWLFFYFTHPKQISFLKILDLAVFGIPFGQAVGRLGNYVNQELYGLPTNLPWGIFIDAQHRIAPYVQDTKFHPLFAYELIFMLAFGSFVWWLDARKKKRFQMTVGSGSYFYFYVMYYAIIRFSLDFLRIDKTMWGSTGLGVNQVFLLTVFVIGLLFFVMKKMHLHRSRLLMFIFGFVAWTFFSACQISSPPVSKTPTFQDHQKAQFTLRNQKLTLEVVNTPASTEQGLSGRDQIGSDGMLFLLGQKSVAQFWMKEMKFNLDFVWLDNGVVRDITLNAPAPTPNQKLSDLPIFSPNVPVDMVLEIDAGNVQKWGIKNGDVLTPTNQNEVLK